MRLTNFNSEHNFKNPGKKVYCVSHHYSILQYISSSTAKYPLCPPIPLLQVKLVVAIELKTELFLEIGEAEMICWVGKTETETGTFCVIVLCPFKVFLLMFRNFLLLLIILNLLWLLVEEWV